MMKRMLLITFLAVVNLLGYAQKVKPVEYGGAINMLEVIEQRGGVFKIRVVGYGKNDAQAQEDAETRVIRMALYVGVEGHYKPLLREETAALDDFFERKQYKDYLLDINSAGGLMKEKGLKVKKKPFDMTIRIGALEDYLRRAKIKKFGL